MLQYISKHQLYFWVKEVGRKPKYPSPSEAVQEWIEEWLRWWNTPLFARKPPEEYKEIIEEKEKASAKT